MAHARRRSSQKSQDNLVATRNNACLTPVPRSEPQQQDAGADCGSPMLGAVAQSAANRPATPPATGAATKQKLSASDVTAGSLERVFGRSRTGSVAAELGIGLEASIAGVLKLHANLTAGVQVSFDDDRRVRAAAKLTLGVGGEVDLALLKGKVGYSFSRSVEATFDSPAHFYAWLQSTVAHYQNAIEQYVKTKAGDKGKDKAITGTKVAAPQVNDQPTLRIERNTGSFEISGQIAALRKQFPWLVGGGMAARDEKFVATRIKDGKAQELHGGVIRRIVKVATTVGSVEVEFSLTTNHPNPDQEGVFWDFRFTPTLSPMALATLKGKKQALGAFRPSRGADPKQVAAELGQYIHKLLAGASGQARVKPTGQIHAQFNGGTDAFMLRFVRIEAGVSAKADGSVPLGASGLSLTGHASIHGSVEVAEGLGRDTIKYVQNVYNGLKRRKDHPKGWHLWMSGHENQLWALLRNISKKGSNPNKELHAISADAARVIEGSAATLGQPKAEKGTLKRLLHALTSAYDQAGNESKNWKEVKLDPGDQAPKTPLVTTLQVTGAASKAKAEVKGSYTGSPDKPPKTVADLYKQQPGRLKVEIPGLESKVRGKLQFDTKNPNIRVDLLKASQIVLWEANRHVGPPPDSLLPLVPHIPDRDELPAFADRMGQAILAAELINVTSNGAT